MADEVRGAGPVTTVGSFPGRGNANPSHQPPKKGAPAEAPKPGDRVTVRHVGGDVLRLLRERVLANTRQALGNDHGHGGPEFAEVLEGEPIAAFVGRLLSAQNQLAARRHGVADLSVAELRALCDQALVAGANETLDLLAGDARANPDAAVVVAEVLAEHARRIAALGNDIDRSGSS